jgi:hypothetical protein
MNGAETSHSTNTVTFTQACRVMSQTLTGTDLLRGSMSDSLPHLHEVKDVFTNEAVIVE